MSVEKTIEQVYNEANVERDKLRAALEEIRDLDVAYKDIHDARAMACEALGVHTDETNEVQS